MTRAKDQQDALDLALAGDRLELARLLTRAEAGGAEFARLHRRVHGRIGGALRIGVTGPPGAGKSTLVEAYVVRRRARAPQEGLAVVAVDPTSPFTGGALLGDRIRMSRVAMDPGCFVRSMASRGSFGGLARTSDDVADVLDAAGFARILIETVGVGQSEVDVVRATDLTVVILVPGTGDGVQAMKAGLMEIADVLVVNKADRPGVERLVAELEEVLDLRGERAQPPPAVVQTVATNGEGLEALDDAIEERLRLARASGAFEARRQRRRRLKIQRLVEEGLRARTFDGKGLAARIEEALAAAAGRSPYDVAEMLLGEIGAGARRGGAAGPHPPAHTTGKERA